MFQYLTNKQLVYLAFFTEEILASGGDGKFKVVLWKLQFAAVAYFINFEKKQQEVKNHVFIGRLAGWGGTVLFPSSILFLAHDKFPLTSGFIGNVCTEVVVRFSWKTKSV